MPDSDNGRVTLAVIQNEIKHLRTDIQRLSEDHENRLRAVEKDTTKLRTATNRQWIATAIGSLAAALSGIFVKGS